MSSDFLLIRPLAVTDAILTSSSVPEALVPEYVGGTTYAQGVRAGVTTGTAQAVYESKQSANSGHAPASSPTWWKLVGTVYAPYSSASFALGAIVTDPTTHQLYQSLVAANAGNALSDTSKWAPLGSTNQRSMFDAYYSSQTTNADTITLVIAPGQVVNCLSLLNVEATSITVTQSVSGWSKTFSMCSHPVNNWYDWFYELPIRVADITITGIPPYPASSLTITIDNTGNTAKCGCCIPGKSIILGTTDVSLDRSITDYSVSNDEGFGKIALLERPYSKDMSVNVAIVPGMESEVARILEAHRAKELVCVACDSIAMTSIYCFLGPWSVPAAGSGKLAHIELKGLT